MLSEFVHRNKGLLSVIVTLVLAVILVTQFGNRTANNEGAAAPVSDSTPTATLTPTNIPTGAAINATPTPPPQDGVSVITATQKSDFENRVLDFEEAYYLPDPKARIEALRPFASDTYLSTLTTEDTSIASDSAADIRITIDRDSASINTESFDEGDSSLQAVSVVLNLTTRRNTDVVTTVSVHHRTVWIKDADNSWRVYSDAP